MGIEPTSEAWEASILPLYDARSLNNVAKAETSRKRVVAKMLFPSAKARKSERHKYQNARRCARNDLCPSETEKS
jgi:hypothetical protein